MTGKNYGRVIRKWSVRGLLAAGTLCILLQLAEGLKNEEQDTGKWRKAAAAFFTRQMEQSCFLVQGYVREGKEANTLGNFYDKIVAGQLPVIGYYLETEEEKPEIEDEFMAQLFREHEGTDEDIKNIEEENLDYGEDALHIENGILEEMERENQQAQPGADSESGADGKGNAEEELNTNERNGGTAGGGDFAPAQYPSYSYDWSEMWDYEQVVSNFYAVDASTVLREDYVNLKKLLEKDLSVDKTREGPQILIYHTHSLESFVDSVEGDPSTTIVGAGERLAKLLEQEYGFRVLHHTGTYDTVREEAYEKALPAIEQVLEENPGIQVIIDLHRDEMASDRKLVMDLQGKPTARFMFFNGLSYTRSGGEITYLENPYIQDNLAFSFQAQVTANEYYPGIARKIYLKAYRYNMHLRPRSMLIELGAQNNTVEEIMNACDPLAHILAIVLDEML